MSVNESGDYKRGWYDGFTAAKNHSPVPVYPANVPINQINQVHMPVYPANVPIHQGLTCSKCGKLYLPQSCCPQTDCPIQPYMRNS